MSPSSARPPGRDSGGNGSGGSAAAPSSFRRTVARLSRPALVWLYHRPRWLLAGMTTALVVVGLAAPRPWGPICLGLVAFLLAWLAYLSWPDGDRGRRVIRLVMVGLALGAFVLRLFE
ncbi:MAG TPA: DUF6703 family protein [Actinopolymorphaceae bacterium]